MVSVLREGDFWVAFTNNTLPNGYILHPHCPYDYCLSATDRDSRSESIETR